MKLITRSSLILLLLMLNSCSYFSNASTMQAQDKNYLTAHSIPPLKIPPGVSSNSFSSDYPVSDRTYPVSQLKVPLTPPGL
jgi:uncharacterized lipoprotein